MTSLSDMSPRWAIHLNKATDKHGLLSVGRQCVVAFGWALRDTSCAGSSVVVEGSDLEGSQFKTQKVALPAKSVGGVNFSGVRVGGGLERLAAPDLGRVCEVCPRIFPLTAIIPRQF